MGYVKEEEEYCIEYRRIMQKGKRIKTEAEKKGKEGGTKKELKVRSYKRGKKGASGNIKEGRTRGEMDQQEDYERS